MTDKIIEFPTTLKADGENVYLFACDEGQIEIKEGDSPLTIGRALTLLDRCSIMLKKQAGWL